MRIPQSKHIWDFPPTQLTLCHEEVHIWRSSLNLEESEIQYLATLLVEDELARANRFRFPKDRNHFIVARGVLRLILSRYLNHDPAQFRFHYSAYGKPELLLDSGQNICKFNLSHSGDLVIYAFTHNREIGIDIERIRPVEKIEQIVTRFFSQRENAEFQTLLPALKQKAFFTCWTRKEAYIKARGEGLSMPLDRFDVSFIPGQTEKLLNTRPDPREASRWTMQELLPAPGYIAALVVEGHDWNVKCWQWRR